VHVHRAHPAARHPGGAPSRGASATRARSGARRPAVDALALLVPLAVLLAGAWSRRWLSDDGFINLRIVEQVWAGNGPVWNAGERVETGTSPLWLGVLAVTGAVARSISLEWIAVALGIAGTVAGLAAATLAARRLHGGSGTTLVPLGALVVAALPPMWDFASSGLETGLTFLWIGTGGWALAAALPGPQGGRRPLLTATLIGLGPLVRPDLALVAAPMLLALLRGSRRLGRAHLLGLVAAAAAVPVLHQLLRMAFFAALVPNTAFAKEGGLSSWSAGWAYAGDHVGTWRLWWPAAAVIAVAVLGVRTPDRPQGSQSGLVVAAVTGGAALHALYVVRVGGDFMHARLLLPATFALALPWAVVPLRRSSLVALGAVLPWALLAAVVWLPPGQPGEGEATGTVDERAYYVALAGRPNPVTAEDFAGVPYASGGATAARLAAAGERALTLATTTPDDRSTWAALARPDDLFTVAVDNVGVFGFLAGPEVSVVDLRGLGDPVTSRFRLVGPRGRPGHEKAASAAWVLGRHAAPGAIPAGVAADPLAVSAARDAVSCGRLADVLDGIREPMSLRRAAANTWLAIRTYGLRVDGDPARAREELCGG
jgi:arabinofuranosyltransferase